MLAFLAASFFLEVVVRNRASIFIVAEIDVTEPRRHAPYAEIPFAAQPRTLKVLAAEAFVRRGKPVGIHVLADSRTYDGRLSRVSPPRR